MADPKNPLMQVLEELKFIIARETLESCGVGAGTSCSLDVTSSDPETPIFTHESDDSRVFRGRGVDDCATARTYRLGGFSQISRRDLVSIASTLADI